MPPNTFHTLDLQIIERVVCEDALHTAGTIADASALLGTTREGLKRRIIKHRIAWPPHGDLKGVFSILLRKMEEEMQALGSSCVGARAVRSSLGPGNLTGISFDHIHTIMEGAWPFRGLIHVLPDGWDETSQDFKAAVAQHDKLCHDLLASYTLVLRGLESLEVGDVDPTLPPSQLIGMALNRGPLSRASFSAWARNGAKILGLAHDLAPFFQTIEVLSVHLFAVACAIAGEAELHV